MVSLPSAAQSRQADTLSISAGLLTDSVSVDSTAFKVQYMPYDSLMSYLGSSVRMTEELGKAMNTQVEKNKARRAQGYRLRIYFDNSQDARAVSEKVVAGFKERYPGVPVFRVYDNPYFKVTVGEFRSKADAMRFLEAIRPEYPTVFLVKESFSTI